MMSQNEFPVTGVFPVGGRHLELLVARNVGGNRGMSCQWSYKFRVPTTSIATIDRNLILEFYTDIASPKSFATAGLERI